MGGPGPRRASPARGEVWDHDPFFDYVDRWMTEDDTQHIEEIRKARNRNYSASYARQRQAWDPFVEQMWAKYRGAIERRAQ
jgi:hypothetical protein